MTKNKIEVQHLSKKFKNQVVLNDLNLTLESGNVYGFLGNNGSGKTTTIKLLFNELTPDAGTITYNGKLQKNVDYTKWYFFAENNELPQNLQIREYLYELAILMHVPYKDFLRRFYEAEEIINVKLSIKKKLKDFSAGQKKLFSAILAITIDPDVIFFDEPTANLDIKNKLIIIEIIKQMISKKRIIVITTHLVDEIKDLINDIIILDSHQIVYDEHFDVKTQDIRKIFTEHTTETTFDPENKLNNFLNKKNQKQERKTK